MTPSHAAMLDRLERHLREENPVLLDAVQSFRRLDTVGWRLGLLPPEQSFAGQVTWWPLIAVLGAFSAGKSTFINGYLGQTVQTTGNQAVDERFTALCFSAEEGPPRTLPGLALDADPRFPFYQVSRDIEEVAAGEGRRIDAYLQLKTCSSPRLRGKILIDSPGFDADAQRTSVLRISDRIIGLADLVLVFFDARRPEPGAMQDTLHHLVERTVGRPDSSKFLYILNQVDNAAREDNPEEVFGAWQRALAGGGLTAGRFYQIYDEGCAIPIEDENLRERFRGKRDADLADIRARMENVEVERAYRVIGMLEKLALTIRDETVPALERARAEWRRRVLWVDVGIVAVVAAGLIGLGAWAGPEALTIWALMWGGIPAGFILVLVLATAVVLHFKARRLAAHAVGRRLARKHAADPIIGPGQLVRAFERNTGIWRPIWLRSPAGWRKATRRRIETVLAEAGRHVQRLNDRFADPSGRRDADARTTDGGSGPHPPDGGHPDEAGEGHRPEHQKPPVRP